MPCLKNVDWVSINLADPLNQFAKAVKKADQIAEACESSISAGKNFYEAITQNFEENPELKENRDMYIKVVGLLYTAWDRHEQFRIWYKHRFGRDLSEEPTLYKASSIMAERVGRTKNRG